MIRKRGVLDIRDGEAALELICLRYTINESTLRTVTNKVNKVSEKLLTG